MSAIPLNTASSYAIIGSSTITNVGATVITGNVGLFPGTSITGFPPGTVNGTVNVANSAASTAKMDANTAYLNAQTRTGGTTISGDLGGLTILPGVFTSSSSIGITGTLTLNANGNPNAVWIFQIASTLTTASGSSVVFQNGIGCPDRVYWQVGSSATLGTTSAIIGNIMALASVTVNGGASSMLNGRAFSLTGAVTIASAGIISNAAALACSGGDPHIVCLDGSRIDVYDEGYYRLFETDAEGESSNHIIINADVRRNPDMIDYYNQLWIKTPTKEILVEFQKDIGIVVEGQTPVDKWVQSYTLNNVNYVITCESLQNTVALSASSSDLKCSGLMAGQISRLHDLKDQSFGLCRQIQPGNYTQNAILAGSDGPHVVTAQKHSLRPRHMWLRLLQWASDASNGICNVSVDRDGRMRELIISVNQDGQLSTDSWKWTGGEHWNLVPSRNNIVLEKTIVHETAIFASDCEILLRIQGNGSVSASFKGDTTGVRGLLFGDIMRISRASDLKFYHPSTPLKPNCEFTNNMSFYQRMIEPMA
jgi:hypothetical protein